MADRVQRRLAAILAADVVGYSRLMEADEAGTRERLRSLHSELIDPHIAANGGRIVKTTGDGILVEFGSAVDAVQNALAIQSAMAGRNTKLPKEQRLVFRVGVNLGDVIIEEDDIHGDGVNVAARLEGLCEPGEVYVSGTVRDHVEGKLPAAFDDLGEQALKNISKPIRVYRVNAKADEPPGAPSLPDKPSIAVLPFENMSGDTEQEYFSDGIAEDIITDLSRIAGLFVIARNSSFTYKGRAVDVKRAASELGVKFVLEGSVRKAANRVRITAQLIDGATSGHLWAERYDRVLDDIFAIQDEITRNIVDALKLELDLEEPAHQSGPGTTNIEAYDLTLRGREVLYRHTAEDNAEAGRLFEQSIALDPGFITAYWGLAIVHFQNYTNGWNDASEKTLESGRRLADKAIEINPENPEAYWALSLACMWSHDLDGALAAVERAVVLGPNFAEAYATRGYILTFASRPAEAIESLEKSMRLDPQHPNIWLHFLAHAHVVAADYERAAALLEQRIRRQPETDISRAMLASCYGHLGREAEAQEQWARLLDINPDYSVEQKGQLLPYKNPDDWSRIVDGLRKAGLPE